jgi:phage host-nuclease inhibitor protein Gam
MAARVTPARVDEKLRKLGELELEIEDVERQLLGELDEVKGRYTGDLARLRRRRDRAEAAVVADCQRARTALFGDEGKTLALGFGKVSWRLKPPSVKPLEGVSEEEVIGGLPPKMRRYVRVQRALDRNAVTKDLAEGKPAAEDLEGLGLELVQGDETWQVKPDHEAVRQAVGQP